MKLIISFCNPPETKKDIFTLLFVDTIKGDQHWLGKELPSIGATGITQDEKNIYAIYQSSPTKLATINKHSLDTVHIQDLEQVQDPHSIYLRSDGLLYVVSTGNDQILAYRWDNMGHAFLYQGVFWKPPYSKGKEDTHHINAITSYQGDICISAFGTKKTGQWSSSTDGYVYNITSEMLLQKNIYHPHSLYTFDDHLFCCESSTRSVLRDGKVIFRLPRGYIRGLVVQKKTLIIGASNGRKRSKSTEMTNNPADEGALDPCCEISIFKQNPIIQHYKKILHYDFSSVQQEIYDVAML